MTLSNDALKILVCCHKPSPVPAGDCFLPIHVGAALSNQNLGIQRDNEVNGKPCENISEKNPNYCELTALFWAWKNIKTLYPHLKYIGLNHYRRYFSFDESRKTGSGIYKNVDEIEKYQIDLEKVGQLLSEGKVIIPPKAMLKTSVASSYEHAHYSTDLRVVHDVVKELYPDYLNDFNQFFICRNYFYDCNMFIMPVEEFSKYCEWLFKILFDVEKRINIKEYDSYQKRIFGFMSERLFTLWVLHQHYNVKNFNYLVYKENASRKNESFITVTKHRLSKMKSDLGFYLSTPRDKSKLEKFWIVP